ncbi:MAG TPA: putative quinol monooxygenase [Granulicella sp.]|nr:putative quinol monooxygenase [Granulicella sp.]
MFGFTGSSAKLAAAAEEAQPQGGSGTVVTRRSAVVRMLGFAAALPTVAGLLGRQAEAEAPARGKALVNLVTFTVPAAGMERFLAISKTNSEASLKEPGITGFEVLIARDTPNTVLLVESYRDEAAYKTHHQAPHFLAFVQGAKEIGATRTAVVANRYFPV